MHTLTLRDVDGQFPALDKKKKSPGESGSPAAGTKFCKVHGNCRHTTKECRGGGTDTRA